MVATRAFVDLAREAADAVGLPEARISIVAHPIGGVGDEGLRERADGAVEEVVALLSGRTR